MIYRTEYMQLLHSFKDSKIIKIITGLRFSGKYTLLQSFRDELIKDNVAENQILYIDFGLLKYDSIRDYKQFYNFVVRNIKPDNKNYLFFDEIQQVKGWEKAVNSLVLEYDVDIYIASSDSDLLYSDFSTLIAGRYVEIKLPSQ
ncbi:MAG: AAA family ATPase [Roseburia sp.]|nr:AAA family ATPase [Roseburia sp.]